MVNPGGNPLALQFRLPAVARADNARDRLSPVLLAWSPGLVSSTWETAQEKVARVEKEPPVAVTVTVYGLASSVPAARVPEIRPLFGSMLKPAGSPVAPKVKEAPAV